MFHSWTGYPRAWLYVHSCIRWLLPLLRNPKNTSYYLGRILAECCPCSFWFDFHCQQVPLLAALLDAGTHFDSKETNVPEAFSVSLWSPSPNLTSTIISTPTLLLTYQQTQTWFILYTRWDKPLSVLLGPCLVFSLLTPLWLFLLTTLILPWNTIISPILINPHLRICF